MPSVTVVISQYHKLTRGQYALTPVSVNHGTEGNLHNGSGVDITKELVMTQEAEGILRRILDELSRVRRRQARAFILLLFVTMGLTVWLGRVSASPVIDVGRTIAVAVIFVVLLMTYVAMGIAMFVTKMTTKVLSAIELVSKG